MSNNMKLSPWPHWPLCHQQPKTHSFRSPNLPEFPFFTDSLPGFIEEKTDDNLVEIENLIHGLTKQSSKRLFFIPEEINSFSQPPPQPPSPPPSSLTPPAAAAAIAPTFEESTMESRNPYLDFKESMEEMIKANDGCSKNWKFLEDLLSWYLKINEKSNHGFIVEAFVDLVFGSCFSSSSSSSPFSCSVDTAITCSSYSLQHEIVLIDDHDDEIECFSTSS